MPTIRKRQGRWQAQVRKAGTLPISKTFEQYADAVTWARVQEGKLSRPYSRDAFENLRTLTLADLIARYIREITPAKRGADIETIRLGKMQRDPLALIAIGKLRPNDVAAYRDRRLSEVSTETVRRELGSYQHVIEVARKEWGLPLIENPVRAIRKPPAGAARQRRLNSGELDCLTVATRKSRSQVFRDVVTFALETAMRRSEVLGIRWPDVDFERGFVRLALTKNGQGRIVPLTAHALALLVRRREAAGDEPRVFPITANSVRLAWQRLVKRAKLADLHFHDLRHEAISRFFEQGLSVPEVALISGHRSPRMLLRYAHVFADEVRRKLVSAPSLTLALPPTQEVPTAPV